MVMRYTGMSVVSWPEPDCSERLIVVHRTYPGSQDGTRERVCPLILLGICSSVAAHDTSPLVTGSDHKYGVVRLVSHVHEH